MYGNTYGGKIDNCTNLCDIYGESHTGGIVGSHSSEVSITNCCNYGNITIEGNIQESYVSVGGILGCGYALIANCCNHGSITNNSTRVYAGSGGIIGNVQDYNGGKIYNCYNTGNISYKYSGGAVVGGYWYSNWLSTIENCFYLEGTSKYRNRSKYRSKTRSCDFNKLFKRTFTK